MNLPKTISLIFFCILFASGLLTVKVARAQIPPPYVDCDDTDSPEFHSLRPYQASPCNQKAEDLALFCGNTLVVSDSVTLNRNQATSCVSLPDGNFRCQFNINRSRDITIDLRDADLPIMGNTELVVNSQNQSEELDDAEKVNEYLSWYLNGVTGRAEYPFLGDDEENIRKIVDFSGPLKKLLPWEGQVRARIETVKRAEDDRHDQVVACTYGLPIKTSIGPFPITLGTLGGIPGPCYNNGIIDFFVNLFKLREEHHLSDWEKKKKLPPLRKPGQDFSDYWVAYKRWRGESCAVVPIPFLDDKKVTLCYDNPAKPNFWSNLFAYIPFSSTEDKKGLVETNTFSAQPVSEDLNITSVTFSNQTPAELFFAHMEESVELAELLQQTFVPQGAEKTGPVTGVSPGASCDLVNVRSNEGDDLFAGQIGGTLSYTAKATCDFAPVSQPATTGGYLCRTILYGNCVPNDWTCNVKYGKIDCPTGYFCGTSCASPVQQCAKTVNVYLSVVSKTPKVDEVWSRTVAGASAIFKSFFPKVGPGGAILGILDIPAATKVTYVGANFAGNPGNQRSGEGAELYFPHIGGIQEYFLKGIQTILRPKGFGEQILSGQPGVGVGGQCANTDSAIAAAISAAASKYSVPASLLRAIFEIEGLDYLANPSAYVCMENAAGAAGLMQITKSTYNVVTCENERLDNDLGVCDAGGGKLSRCDVGDVFELAARTLLWKAGKWVYGPGNCRATGGISAGNKQEIYDASCRYYGSYAPDNLTINLSKSIPADKRRQGADMNYCDIVCYKMGQCPPYP
ncbi:MAG: hypothetical protein AAB875_03670 [Patescibacteria group bacterium]